MNIIIVTSVIIPIMDNTIFSKKERITQTIDTLLSIKNKIPNNYIIIVEGSTIDQYEFKNIFESYSNYIYFCDVSNLRKTQGEITLLYQYFNSEHFKSFEKNINTISKLSGRYYLNDKFIWDEFPEDKFIALFVEKSWSGKSVFETRYYRIPKHKIKYFIDKIIHYRNHSYFLSGPDIEHCFSYFNIIDKSELYSPKILGISGRYTNGETLDE